MKALLYITLIFCVISCKKEAATQEVEAETTTLQITKKDVSSLKYRQFLLDPRTVNSEEFWLKYDELRGIVSNVNQADFSFFKDNNEVLIAFIKDLKESIPEEINTPLIRARLLALETKMLKLEGIINLTNPDKKEVLLVLQDFLEAFSNLNLQINKKFEKEWQNIEKPY
ncbi:hypothetical protein ACFSSB_10395 [Lacinutrix gracilariae]|uniref:Uncharacterized protein n=1 Tax=Lacinutrix gracilariae TaxID=1747198 RepID=A0ABW5K1S0_9FLAO